MPRVGVLFVDDEPAIRALFRTILELQGYRTTCASSAREACALLSRLHFDLVITDMHMEDSTSGRQVIAAALGQLPRPAIVILTAYVMRDDEWRETGADELFVKGTDVLTITGRLRQLLDPAHRAAAS